MAKDRKPVPESNLVRGLKRDLKLMLLPVVAIARGVELLVNARGRRRHEDMVTRRARRIGRK